MKNKLKDLNDHLFMQLERLGDETMSIEQIDFEVHRTRAIVAISDQIIHGAKTQLAAAKLAADYGHEVQDTVFPMIERKVGP